jgi:DnaJ-class molecular chaperone
MLSARMSVKKMVNKFRQVIMNANNDSGPKRQTPCPGCGGSGQTSFFGGASRFMLTWEDCPDCCGTGIVLDEPDPEQQDKDNNKDTSEP